MTLLLKYNGKLIIDLDDTNTLHTLVDDLHAVHTSNTAVKVRSTGVKRYDGKMYILTSMEADAEIATLEDSITSFAEDIVATGFEGDVSAAEDEISVHS